MVTSGKERAWENLAGCSPGEVCARAEVSYDEARGVYVVPCFGQGILVCPAQRTFQAQSPAGERIVTRFDYFASLVILSYLAQAKAVPPSGHWVKPGDLRSGDVYYRGSHVLPLDRLSKAYEGRLPDFIQRAELLGGSRLSFGDASFKLLPLPRMPVALILWNGDDEFPGRADLLLDSTCELHLPADVIWSAAMLSVLMMS